MAPQQPGSPMLVAIGTLGWLYLARALLSGGALLYYAIRLIRTRSLTGALADLTKANNSCCRISVRW